MDKAIQAISSLLNTAAYWAGQHPKATIAIVVFTLGFLLGILL
jgi:hypothetical protein